MKNILRKIMCMAVACAVLLTMSSVSTMAYSPYHHHCTKADANGNCIHLNEYSVTMYKTASRQLKAVAYGESSTVTWTSSNTAVATVDSTGKVTAVAAGSCNITASANGVSTSCKVTVKAASLKLSRSKKTMTVGKKYTLSAKVFGPSKKVTWTSDNTAVATVNSRGRIKAVAVGTCNISATANGVTVKCAINVQSASIKLNKTAKTIKLNRRYTLRAKVKGKSRKVTWTSSDSTIATVSKRGVIRAKKAGTCNITATANGVSAVCAVTVQ